MLWASRGSGLCSGLGLGMLGNYDERDVADVIRLHPLRKIRLLQQDAKPLKLEQASLATDTMRASD